MNGETWCAAPDPRLPADLDTPALVVELSVLRHTASAMVRRLRSQGVALRPHAKTHKSARLAKLLIALGAQGATAATPGTADGAGVVRTLAYSAACRCLQYRGAPRQVS